jgi:hypothetical protein
MDSRMLREEIARLIEELNKAEQELNDKDSYGDYVGRTPAQQDPVKTVQLTTTSQALMADHPGSRDHQQNVAYKQTL